MAETKRNFWTTVPGVISGVAAIVTGLGVLIPIMLGVGSKHPAGTNTASQNNATNTAGPSASPSVTSTVGGTDTSTPSPADSLGAAGTDTASPSSGAGTALPLTAGPTAANFGSVRAGLSSSDTSITVTNPGGTPVTIDHVSLTGTGATQFAISSTTCGDGATIAPKGSCQVSARFTPTSGLAGSPSAKLRVDYHPPVSSFLTIDLSGTASIL